MVLRSTLFQCQRNYYFSFFSLSLPPHIHAWMGGSSEGTGKGEQKPCLYVHVVPIMWIEDNKAVYCTHPPWIDSMHRDWDPVWTVFFGGMYLTNLNPLELLLTELRRKQKENKEMAIMNFGSEISTLTKMAKPKGDGRKKEMLTLENETLLATQNLYKHWSSPHSVNNNK